MNDSNHSNYENKNHTERLYLAKRATKETVFRFWESLDMNKRLIIKTKFQQTDVFQMVEKSFFAVEVTKKGETIPEALFFYALEGELSPQKWGLPIPLHDFDYCGSLFLKVSKYLMNDSLDVSYNDPI